MDRGVKELAALQEVLQTARKWTARLPEDSPIHADLCKLGHAAWEALQKRLYEEPEPVRLPRS